jgi:hypothetical protein
VPGKPNVSQDDNVYEKDLDDLWEKGPPLPERGLDVQQTLLVQPVNQLEEITGYSSAAKTISRRHCFTYLPCRASTVDQREHETCGLVDPNPVAGHGIEEMGVLE